jgi:uncharacterized protein (TIGR03067 family)
MKLRLFSLLAVALLIAADEPANKADLDKLQGTWKLTQFEGEGKKQSGDEIGSAKLVVKDDKYTYTAPNEKEGGTLKLDAGKKPRTIDIIITEGTGKDMTQLGVYELEGDTFKVCVTQPGDKERPTDFTTKEGSKNIVFTFKRDKP